MNRPCAPASDVWQVNLGYRHSIQTTRTPCAVTGGWTLKIWFLERKCLREFKTMKLTSIAAGLAILIVPACLAAQPNSSYAPDPSSHAWNHGEIAIFADYYRFTQFSPTANFVGVGGLVGFNASPHVAFEAEMTYDFARNFTSQSGNGASTSFSRTSLRPLTGLFGPKFQMGSSGPVRAFVTGKVGFVDFSTSSKAISGSSFTGAVNNIGGSATHFAAYPGGGIEFFGGPFGFRIEAGDQIYLDDGVHNDLKVDAGPAFRF